MESAPHSASESRNDASARNADAIRPAPRGESDAPPNSRPERAANPFAVAHARFARAALGIYFAAASIALAMLLATLATDLTHEQDQLRERLLIESDERGHYLAQHLGLLVQELRRLGLRSEVNLLDQNLAPEQSLLRLSHERSTFFNLGVAILGAGGELVWAEPENFLPIGSSFASEPWFASMKRSQTLRIVPVMPDRAGDAVLYVVSPVLRNQQFAGALLGAVDLAKSGEFALGNAPGVHAVTIVATGKGEVVYPPTPPKWASESAWKELFREPIRGPVQRTADIAGKSTTIGCAPVSGTDLYYLLLADDDALFHNARARLRSRLAIGLVLAVAPLAVLVLFLKRSLALFRESEERAVREERLRLVGEAANLIAHEAKNSLNGISMGLELVCREPPPPPEKRRRLAAELMREIRRLSDFAGELMTFSKGIVPKRVPLDLRDLILKVTALAADAAEEAGTAIEHDFPDEPVRVEADPSLLHVVVSNLVTNAVEAVSTAPSNRPRRVKVRVRAVGREAVLDVTDTGPGVPLDVQRTLFEPFRTGKPSGVGIGLALSKRIAVAHGGDLVLSAMPNVGARFVVTLPLDEQTGTEA